MMKTNREINSLIDAELRGIRELTTVIWERYDLGTSLDDLVTGDPSDYMRAISHLEDARNGLFEVKKCFSKHEEQRREANK